MKIDQPLNPRSSEELAAIRAEFLQANPSMTRGEWMTWVVEDALRLRPDAAEELERRAAEGLRGEGLTTLPSGVQVSTALLEDSTIVFEAFVNPRTVE